MASEPLVTAADVLEALRQVRRLGNTAALTQLEQQEPELLALLLEEVSSLHHRLGRHLPTKLQRQVTHRIERLGTVLVLALQLAHRRLDEPNPG